MSKRSKFLDSDSEDDFEKDFKAKKEKKNKIDQNQCHPKIKTKVKKLKQEKHQKQSTMI